MSCKLTKALLLLCACGIVIQTTDAIIYTLGGLVLDSALAFLVFGKWLALPLFLGKRSIDTQLPTLGPAATAEEYLAVASSIDTNKCLPLVVCAAMARSKTPGVQLTPFDALIVNMFSGKLEDGPNGEVSPMDFYREAAKFGSDIGKVEQCRPISKTCTYTMDELRNITQAVSQYHY